MKSSSIEIGQRLKAIRKEKNVTQTMLAESLSVSRSCITNWESGERMPEYEVIVEMAKVFGVPVDYFYGRCEHRYVINVPDYLELDLSKLNDEGIGRIQEYYRFLLSDEKFRR